MPLRAPSTDARISKAKKMREEENKKQHRERLRAMLMQKLRKSLKMQRLVRLILLSQYSIWKKENIL